MTWTYSGDPSANNRDEIRFMVGDTDTNDQLVTDEEIAYAIAEEDNNLLAASRIANAIAAQFARRTDTEVGDLRKWYSQRFTQYTELANKLRQRGGLLSSVPYVGGISIDDKQSAKDDSDRVKPRFSRGQFSDLDNSESPERLSADI